MDEKKPLDRDNVESKEINDKKTSNNDIVESKELTESVEIVQDVPIG